MIINLNIFIHILYSIYLFYYISLLQTGVIQLLSKCASFGFSGGKDAPLRDNSERILSISLIFSIVSLDARNRRDLC